MKSTENQGSPPFENEISEGFGAIVNSSESRPSHYQLIIHLYLLNGFRIYLFKVVHSVQALVSSVHPMKIQYASDLHLEFKENKQWLLANPIKPTGDVLVLAGDIILFGLLESNDDFFNYLSDHFEQTFWLPGNHEYYYYNLAERCGTLQENIRKNVTLVNNVALDYHGVHFVFSTLWTHISPIRQLAIQHGMADFKVIQYNGKPFIPAHYNAQHEACKKFLETEFARQAKKTIVVTHHVPTLLNYPEQYRGSVLNEAFAVELYDLIANSKADYWIYGHHHQAIPPFTIGSTTLLCNQLGYVHHHEHRTFNTSAIIEMD